MTESTYIALVRGINVGGKNKLLMADLRALVADLGWRDARTYIQSGNVVFSAAATPAVLADALESEIARVHSMSVAVIIRDAVRWKQYLKANPFLHLGEESSGLVMLALSKRQPNDAAADALRARATLGEEIRHVGDALWIHYPEGAGRSKLSPGLLDRVVGSPVTTRNWRTVLALERRCRPPPPSGGAGRRAT